MTHVNRRVLMRAIIEDPAFDHDTDIGMSDIDIHDAKFVGPTTLARIAALEAEDTANPIAAAAVVRSPLELVLDEAAVISKFPQEEK